MGWQVVEWWCGLTLTRYYLHVGVHSTAVYCPWSTMWAYVDTVLSRCAQQSSLLPMIYMWAYIDRWSVMYRRMEMTFMLISKWSFFCCSVSSCGWESLKTHNNNYRCHLWRRVVWGQSYISCLFLLSEVPGLSSYSDSEIISNWAS